MQVCTSLQTDNHTSTHHSVFYRPDALPAAQPTVSSTEGIVPVLLLHLFNNLFSRTVWVSRYRKGKTSLDLNEASEDWVLGCSGISWTIICTSLQTDNHTNTHNSIFTGRMLFLMPNQQCQSTEGKVTANYGGYEEIGCRLCT